MTMAMFRPLLHRGGAVACCFRRARSPRGLGDFSRTVPGAGTGPSSVRPAPLASSMIPARTFSAAARVGKAVAPGLKPRRFAAVPAPRQPAAAPGLRSLVARRSAQRAGRLHTLSRPKPGTTVSSGAQGLRSRPVGIALSAGPFGTVRAAFRIDPVLFRMCHPLHLHLGSMSHLTSWQHTPPGGGGGGRKPPSPRNRITAGIGAVGTGLVLLAGKGKYLLGALKLTKFASLGSMLLTVGTYSMFFGLPYAAGMVGLIVVHESGHALVMRHFGIPFSPMVFVPFLGASVMMKRQPRDAYQEALIAFGGPVLGSLGAAGVAMGGAATDSQLLYALADFGYMINLFNLLPIGMMDGGRICGALSPYAGVVGLGLGGMLAYEGMVSNPIFYLILLAGGYQTFTRLYYPESVPLNYYRITTAQRMAITGGYFGLVAALFAGMAMNARSKKSPEQLRRERELAMYRYD